MPTPARSRIFGHDGWALGVIGAFWLALFFTGYPAPFIDDLWYAGPAVSLVQHGTFSNPFCEVLGTIGSRDFFLAYMPLHAYVLAGWLAVFGLGSGSLCAFHTLLAAGVSFALYDLVRPPRDRVVIAFLICVLVAVLLGGAGFRPDALGLLLLVLGLRIYRAGSMAPFFLGCLFLALAVITSVNTAGLDLFVPVSALVFQRVVGNLGGREILRRALVGALAFGLAFVLLLWLIDFRLHDFLTCTAAVHQDAVAGVRQRFLDQLFTPYWFAKWIVCQAALLVFLAVCWFRTTVARTAKIVLVLSLLAGDAILAWVSFSSAAGSHWWAFGCVAAMLFLLVRHGGSRRMLGIWAVLLPIFILGHGHEWLENLVAARAPDQRPRILAEVVSLKPAKIYVDEYAWREVYDCRLPENGFDFESARVLGGYSNYLNLPAGSIAVVSVKRAGGDYTKSLGHVVRVLGRTDLFANPYDLVLIDRRAGPP